MSRKITRCFNSVRRMPSGLPRNPLIAIIGATGTGKSQLAVELAKRFNGEVINGDAMQLYHGLPIITNKISDDDRQGIPHHLLGSIGLDRPTWVVGKFVAEAMKVIDEIRSRGRLPILVGGTHYYTQHLLFGGDLASETAESVHDEPAEMEAKWPILAQPTDVLLEKLREVDPVSAGQWHPNDRRKIQRSLTIFLQTGRPASRIYAEQHEPKNVSTSSEMAGQGDTIAPSMTYTPLLLWLHADNEILKARLDRRVDDMLQRGLLDEVSQLHDYLVTETKQGNIVDESRGIWVSIGYKEFKPYLVTLEDGSNSDQIAKAKLKSIERTKIATRQYAKRQIRWIRIKLTDVVARAGLKDDFYVFDATDTAAFDENAVLPAIGVVESFLEGSAPLLPQHLSSHAAKVLSEQPDADNNHRPAERSVQSCSVCYTTCATIEQWKAHVTSRKHRKLMSKAKNQEVVQHE